MAYQKCPICDGTGVFKDSVTTNTVCPTCKGTRIISEFNGLPPTYVKSFNLNNNSINHGSQVYPGNTHLPLD